MCFEAFGKELRGREVCVLHFFLGENVFEKKMGKEMGAQLTVFGSSTRRQPSAQARKKASEMVSCKCSMSSSCGSGSASSGPSWGLAFKRIGSVFVSGFRGTILALSVLAVLVATVDEA